MRVNSTVFVVVPAYNECRVIRGTVQPLIEMGYSVVVVDDASTDGTTAMLRGLDLHILRHRINRGAGAATQTGMSFALARGASYIVHFDADGQHRSQDIPVLLAPLFAGRADVVLGSRFLRAADRAAVPRARRLLLRGGVVFNGLLTGLWLTDAHNGLRAFTAEAAARIDIRENGFAHGSEILQQIKRARLRCIEQPTMVSYTAYSMAKGQSPLNAIKIVFDLLLRRLFR
jgi:polyprenyl-phospho-N-acetylgalactosaminyl synthase